jgi:hypothetical protein
VNHPSQKDDSAGFLGTGLSIAHASWRGLEGKDFFTFLQLLLDQLKREEGLAEQRARARRFITFKETVLSDFSLYEG